MLRLACFILLATDVTSGPWWRSQPVDATETEQEPEDFNEKGWYRWRRVRDYSEWLSNLDFSNRTYVTFDQVFEWPQMLPPSVEGFFWTIFDMMISTVGWLIFGQSWNQVRTGFSVLIRLGVAICVCIIVHYLFALCWPIVSLMVGVILTLIWMIRTLVKCCGRAVFYAQRFSGGVPEALDAKFFGPGTGETPETSDLRKLKKGSDGDRWLVVKREGMHAIFKVNDATSIKSAGLYVYHDPDTLRGDLGLLKDIEGHDRLHLCRNQACQEEGQHFKQYAVVTGFNAEKFHLSAAANGAQQAGAQLCGWFGKKASQAAQRAKDFGSESEAEASRCDAGKIRWEDETGRHQLSVGSCTEGDCTEVSLLQEDVPVGCPTCSLCPKHASKYMKERFQLKCCMAGCEKLGLLRDDGLRLCDAHGSVGIPPPPTGPRRSSRSRSRTKAKEETQVDFETDAEELSPQEGLRRRRQRGAAEEEARDLLEVTKNEEETAPSSRRKRRPSESSPGCTPKSTGVQKSLAKLGMINSPDRRETTTTLEEFMEQLVDGKDLGLEEEDVRTQLALRYGIPVKDFTKMLYDQATEEQRKGTKGLTKFLAKWRKQLAAEPGRSRPREDSWSVIGTPPDAGSIARTPSTPRESAMDVSSATPVSTPQPTPKKTKGLAVLGPPGIYGQGDRKAGTGGDEAGGGQVAELAKAIQHQTSELATLVKAQSEASSSSGAGTIKSLNRTSEELVYLLRACGQYTVEVGEGEHGAGLAQALLSAHVGASTRLREAGFRQRVTPRLAVGLAGPFWGTQEKFALAAADFTLCTDAKLDQHAVDSRVGKPVSDQRPAAPTRFEDWQSRVRRETDIWCLVYGKEWRGVREHALETLSTWHSQAPHKWPLTVLIDIWEELHWRFFEELKMELRKVKNLAGRETMTLQDLKFYALMPDDQGQPPLQLPRTFDLQYPEGWFMQEVLPRINRRQERILWKMTWEGSAKPRGGAPAGGESTHAGSEEKLSLKSLYGPKLTAEESNRAKDRAPTNREGKLLCWGYLTHLGCSQQGCQRAHENLRGIFEALDPAVRMQLLRRGGLKRMKAETKDSASEKIKELRQQVAKDKDPKVKEGQERRRAGKEATESSEKNETSKDEKNPPGKAGGVTWAPPEEMVNIDYTKQEQEFAEIVKGPSLTVFQHTPREGKPHPGRNGETAPQIAQDLLREAQRLTAGPVLKALEGASDDLYAWASTRVAQDPTIRLDALMEEMTQYGLGDLADEAASILEKVSEPRAGSGKRCDVGEVHWEGCAPGKAVVTIDGQAWSMYDFKEEVQMTEELAGLIGVVQPETEKRQCVTKVLAAGHLWSSTGQVPAMEAVEELAQQYRLEQARQAAEAEGIMGHAEAKVSAIEHELRMYAHDILKANHDKDYRSLAVHPLEHYVNKRLVVMRVDYKGDLLPEVVVGTQWRTGQPTIWVLVHRGHMTLLLPPAALAKEQTVLGPEVYTIPCLGFHYFWHQRHDQPRTAPGTLACRHCKPPKRAGTAEVISFVRKETCLAAAAAYIAGGTSTVYKTPPATTPAGPTGLVLQEYFAGHGVISQGWRDAGEVALEEIELYADPHHQRGARPGHDLCCPEVQARCLDQINADKCTVEWIACPCTSYCDWNLQNKGTRTFADPLGKPTPKEAMGNTLSTFGAAAFEAALKRGHFPIAESSGISGRYPKQWNLPVWQRLLARDDVDFLEVDMCAYALGPPGAPGQFYRRRTGLAFPRHAGFKAALFRLCPGLSAQHAHVPLQGCRDGTTVTRCTEAGVYAPAFVQAVVSALQTFVVGGGGRVLYPHPSRAGGQEAEQGEDTEAPRSRSPRRTPEAVEAREDHQVDDPEESNPDVESHSMEGEGGEEESPTRDATVSSGSMRNFWIENLGFVPMNRRAALWMESWKDLKVRRAQMRPRLRRAQKCPRLRRAQRCPRMRRAQKCPRLRRAQRCPRMRRAQMRPRQEYKMMTGRQQVTAPSPIDFKGCGLLAKRRTRRRLEEVIRPLQQRTPWNPKNEKRKMMTPSSRRSTKRKESWPSMRLEEISGWLTVREASCESSTMSHGIL